MRIGLLLGSGSGFDNSYFIAGGGLGYYVIDGLEVGFEASRWFGDEPNIRTFSPETRYVLHMVPVVKPYLGTFYQRDFISGEYRGFEPDDVDRLGARVGAFFVTSGGSFFGGGIRYETIISDCEGDCSDVLPELSISVAL